MTQIEHEWAIGDQVCDMHYGLPKKEFIPPGVPIETRNHVRVSVRGSTDILQSILSNTGADSFFYTNKIAVVVESLPSGWYVAAYSYDNTTLGLFEFRQAR